MQSLPGLTTRNRDARHWRRVRGADDGLMPAVAAALALTIGGIAIARAGRSQPNLHRHRQRWRRIPPWILCSEISRIVSGNSELQTACSESALERELIGSAQFRVALPRTD